MSFNLNEFPIIQAFSFFYQSHKHHLHLNNFVTSQTALKQTKDDSVPF